MTKKNQAIVEGALMLALSQILSYLKLLEMPQGGSLTLSMVPIMIYCYRWGLGPGLMTAFALGLLQLVLDGAYTWGWQSIFLDYLIAYGLLGTAGAFRRMPGGLYLGAAAGGILRLLSHLVSGYFFVKDTTSFDIYGVQTTSPWLYSLIYNGSYMIPNILLCLLALVLLRKPLAKYMVPQD